MGNEQDTWRNVTFSSQPQFPANPEIGRGFERESVPNKITPDATSQSEPTSRGRQAKLSHPGGAKTAMRQNYTPHKPPTGDIGMSRPERRLAKT
jgi:hypothetical protein